tara:strand:+ start:2706 stop:3770 length:1065 start_codon:yes stop_codon:yes gene_type:complete
MSFREFINYDPIERVRIPEQRDLINGIRCNRNERVEYWDKEFVDSLFSNINNVDFSLYPDLSVLYKALASYENIKSENLLIGSGIDGIIKNIYETYTTKNMNVGLLSPSYAMYYVYSKLFECNLVQIGYSFSTFKLNIDLLFESLEKIDLLFIPNPNQPIEDNLSFDLCRKLAEECNKKNVLLIFDEAYYGFGCESSKNLIYDFDNVGVMRTFSKYFGMPSLRVGYLMANENLVKTISQKRISYETNSICQKIIINLLSNLDYIDKYNKEVCISRDKLKNDFKNSSLRVNANDANYLLVDFDKYEIKKRVTYNLEKEKIYTKSNFKNEMENSILMTVGPYNIMSKIKNIFLKNL